MRAEDNGHANVPVTSVTPSSASQQKLIAKDLLICERGSVRAWRGEGVSARVCGTAETWSEHCLRNRSVFVCYASVFCRTVLAGVSKYFAGGRTEHWVLQI